MQERLLKTSCLLLVLAASFMTSVSFGAKVTTADKTRSAVAAPQQASKIDGTLIGRWVEYVDGAPCHVLSITSSGLTWTLKDIAGADETIKPDRFQLGSGGKVIYFTAEMVYSRDVFAIGKYTAPVRVMIKRIGNNLSLQQSELKVEHKPGLVVTRPASSHVYKRSVSATPDVKASPVTSASGDDGKAPDGGWSITVLSVERFRILSGMIGGTKMLYLASAEGCDAYVVVTLRAVKGKAAPQLEFSQEATYLENEEGQKFPITGSIDDKGNFYPVNLFPEATLWTHERSAEIRVPFCVKGEHKTYRFKPCQAVSLMDLPAEKVGDQLGPISQSTQPQHEAEKKLLPEPQPALAHFWRLPDTAVVGSVDGIKVTKGDLMKTIWFWDAPIVLEAVLDEKMVEQAAAKAGVEVTQKEIQDKLADLVEKAKVADIKDMLKTAGITYERLVWTIRIQLFAEKCAQQEGSKASDVKEWFSQIQAQAQKDNKLAGK